MSTSDPKILDSMPVHPYRGEADSWGCLRIEGLVGKPLELNKDNLKDLPQMTFTEDFLCEEGWVVPDQSWDGILLRDLLGLAAPLPDSNYVAIHAGEYSIGLTLYEIYTSNILIALKLNSETLTPDHGGPCRLVTPAKLCYYSVKWVDRIEVMAMQPHGTGEELALARIT